MRSHGSAESNRNPILSILYILVRLVPALPCILGPLALTVIAMALGLRLLNEVPAYVAALAAPPTPAPFALNERLDYPSLEAAEADLGVKIATPLYFPSYLVWPPASLRGQREPTRVVALRFHSSNGQEALQIREIFWPGETLPYSVPEPLEVLSRQEADVDGAVGQLLLGRGQGDTPVNQLRWRVGDVHLIATTIYSPEELLRIARSMHE